MKIRRPWLIKVTGFAAAWAVRLWMGTLRYRYRSLGPNVEPTRPGLEGRYIFVIWHENMLFPAYFFARPDMWPLISEHADGQLVYEVCRNLNIRPIRGSSSRGSIRALRKMLRVGKKAHLWITPDGPRGPRRQVQAGVVFLASRTGLPIVAMGIGFERPWRMKSWDRFALPRPWSLGTCVTSEPITIPPDAGRNQLESFRCRVEQEMLQVTELADQWAVTGRWPGSSALLSRRKNWESLTNHQVLPPS